MRFIGIGLAAALSLAFMAPAAVMSAPKKPAALPADGIDPKARAAGMAALPALLTQGGLNCTLAEGRLIGEDKKAGSAYYEFSCSTGVGGVLVSNKTGAAPSYFNCLETNKPQPDGKPSSLFCKLSGNADPKAQLAPFVAKTPIACPIADARAIGSSPTASYFELGCADGSGFILVTSAPMSLDKDVKMNTCLAYEAGGNISCELSTREAQLAVVDKLMAASGKTCAISDKRYILTTINFSTYFEVACGDGKGYVLERNAAGALVRAIDCANAPSGAECNLTDSREAKTEQAGLYSRLATKAGFQCTVSKYAMFPSKPREEVVELQCSNRPDGGVAVFDADGNGKVSNCVLSLLDGRKCSFSEQSAAFPAVTADLKSMGKSTCTVSEARPIGRTANGDGYLEVGCSDGLPGWVLVYGSASTKPKEVLSCKQAAGVGGGCKITNNLRS
jgi:hypothetical protein